MMASTESTESRTLAHVQTSRMSGAKPPGRQEAQQKSSLTGIRTLVLRVRAAYPDQLDYKGLSLCGGILRFTTASVLAVGLPRADSGWTWCWTPLAPAHAKTYS